MWKSGIIEFVKEGHIGILTINNPPKNRLADPVIADPDVLRKWFGDEGLRGAILTGSGNNFSEGADLNSLEAAASDPESLLRKLNRGKEALTVLKDSPVPVVAAIKGACFGGGLEIALACHIRVVADTALLGFPEAELSLLPGLGGTISSVEEITVRYALPLLLSSEMITGEKAFEIGLAQHVVQRKHVFDKAREVLENMVGDKKTHVINMIMKAVVNGQRLDKLVAQEEESRMFCELVRLKMHEKEIPKA